MIDIIVSRSKRSNILSIPSDWKSRCLNRRSLSSSIVKVKLIWSSRQMNRVFVDLILSSVKLKNSKIPPSVVVNSANARLTIGNSPATNLIWIITPVLMTWKSHWVRSYIISKDIFIINCVSCSSHVNPIY